MDEVSVNSYAVHVMSRYGIDTAEKLLEGFKGRKEASIKELESALEKIAG